MPDFLLSRAVQLALQLAVLVGLVTAAALVVRRLRGQSEKDQPSASDLLSKFRESHLRGDLDDEEFRRLRQVLGSALRRERADRPRAEAGEPAE